MVESNRTTIEISDSVRDIYEKLKKRYNIRSVVSAGVLLLSRLSPEEREKVIDEANGLIEQAEAARKVVDIAVQKTEARKQKRVQCNGA